MSAPGYILASQFGLPERMSRLTAQRMHQDLISLWRVTFGRDLGSIEEDLDVLRSFFDPVASGRRLREQLLEVPTSVSLDLVPDDLAINVAEGTMLITPEGRLAVTVLADALATDQDPVPLNEALALTLAITLLERYREWGRHRLSGVVRLLEGGRALQISAVGGALTLLVNRSDRPERAMPRMADARSRDAIDAVFRASVAAFAQVIAPSARRSTEKERLISGWTLHEVNRRLPGALVIEHDRIYVDSDRREGLVGFLGAELARPRRHLDLDRVSRGYDALVDALREKSDVLASFGKSFERPSETRRLREALLAAFDVAAVP